LKDWRSWPHTRPRNGIATNCRRRRVGVDGSAVMVCLPGHRHTASSRKIG
jgi:hypothetical protein